MIIYQVFKMVRWKYNRFFRKILPLLLFALLLGVSACTASTPLPAKYEPPPSEKDACSVFIYICGSDLETRHGAATKNIHELLDADLVEGVNIILQTGGAKKWRDFSISSSNLQRYAIEGSALKLLENLPSASMGNADTLADFLCYGIENYPADKYAVILWNHGGGSLSGVAFDEQYGYDALTISELQEAFGKAANQFDEKFELIGIDACLMATLETAQALAPFGSYMVASQEISPSAGWDYTVIAKSMPLQSGAALGQTICDSSYEKCRAQDKDQTVTLSVIDLNMTPVLTASFEALIEKMESDQNDLSVISKHVDDSLGFGGSTKHEGHSNLFDLGCFAENMSATALIAAIRQTVVYQRTGKQRAGATGLSFYYPQTYNQIEAGQYIHAFSETKYAAFLTAAFADMPQSTVEFSDAGSMTNNGGLSIKISQNSVQFLSAVEFELMTEDSAGQTIKLGLDNSLYDDWATGLFSSDFQGYWIALDEKFLQSHPVDQTENSLIFSAPILLNGELTNLRFAFVFEQLVGETHDALEGRYEILGTWSGLDQETGMSKTDVRPLAEGDAITIMHEGLSGKLEPADTVVYRNNTAIYDQPLEEGIYRYRFVVTDIFGNKHTSDTAIFEVGRTAEGHMITQLLRIEKSINHSQDP